DEPAVVGADRVQPGVARIQVRLEDLDTLLGDHSAPDATYQLLALAGDHHAGDHLDPAGAGTVKHSRLQGTAIRRQGSCQTPSRNRSQDTASRCGNDFPRN